jgi:hypothetical protein
MTHLRKLQALGDQRRRVGRGLARAPARTEGWQPAAATAARLGRCSQAKTSKATWCRHERETGELRHGGHPAWRGVDGGWAAGRRCRDALQKAGLTIAASGGHAPCWSDDDDDDDACEGGGASALRQTAVLLRRRARITSGTATQSARGNDSPGAALDRLLAQRRRAGVDVRDSVAVVAIDAPCPRCLRHGDPMHAQE